MGRRRGYIHVISVSFVQSKILIAIHGHSLPLVKGNELEVEEVQQVHDKVIHLAFAVWSSKDALLT